MCNFDTFYGLFSKKTQNIYLTAPLSLGWPYPLFLSILISTLHPFHYLKSQPFIVNNYHISVQFNSYLVRVLLVFFKQLVNLVNFTQPWLTFQEWPIGRLLVNKFWLSQP